MWCEKGDHAFTRGAKIFWIMLQEVHVAVPTRRWKDTKMLFVASFIFPPFWISNKGMLLKKISAMILHWGKHARVPMYLINLSSRQGKGTCQMSAIYFIPSLSPTSLFLLCSDGPVQQVAALGWFPLIAKMAYLQWFKIAMENPQCIDVRIL